MKQDSLIITLIEAEIYIVIYYFFKQFISSMFYSKQ